jgi:Anti-sigma-28 factor, FlgM
LVTQPSFSTACKDLTLPPSTLPLSCFLSPALLQRITELICKGDQLRADKVRQIKEQIKTGQHQVDSKEVAKSIARSVVSRLLDEKK